MPITKSNTAMPLLIVNKEWPDGGSKRLMMSKRVMRRDFLQILNDKCQNCTNYNDKCYLQLSSDATHRSHF